MKYRVLWIDDECEENKSNGFKEIAEYNDISLDSVKSSNKGIEKLKTEDIDFYEAVIIDGITFLEENQKKKTEDELAVQEVISELRKLEGKRKIPFFLYTAQAEKLPSNNLELINLKKYVKGKDHQLLFDDIKKAAAEREDVKIKQKYEHAFQLIDSEVLDKKLETCLLEILKGLNNVTCMKDCESLYNPIRKVIEGVFVGCNQIGILHDNCLDDKGHCNMTWSSLFLSGRNVKVEGVEIKNNCSPFGYHISRAVQDILDVTNEESHLEQKRPKTEGKMQQYRRYVKTPYLFKSIVYRMLDVLEWYKNYISINADIEVNKSHWEEIR